MITPVFLKNYNTVNSANLQSNQKVNQQVNQNSLKLSGFYNPMRSYVTFGWCTAHYQAMYEIDEKFTQKINDKLKEIENLKERYSLVNETSMQAAAILTQYANLQNVLAEVPPSYALITSGKLKEAMNSTKTFANPVKMLVSINNISKMGVKNEKLNTSQLERGKGATQLYSIAILLKQIEENKDKPEFQQTKSDIEALTSIVTKSLKNIYGEDILERMDKFGNMGKNPTGEEKRAALDFLVEVDSKAKDINLPDEFEEKLKLLLKKQNDVESRIQDPTAISNKQLMIKISYPDHDHHHNDHDYMHQHNIPHAHEHPHQPDYKSILKNKQETSAPGNIKLNLENNKKIQDKGEN